MNENPYEPPDADITPELEKIDINRFGLGCCGGIVLGFLLLFIGLSLFIYFSPLVTWE